MTSALANLRILDFTTTIAGPHCTRLFADLGAEVIKVESPEGDMTRRLPPHFVGSESAYYLSVNRNKRSMAVDMKTEQGRAVIARLALACDVVVENFRPGILKRLGLSYEDIAAQKPGIALYVGGMGAREVNFHNEHMRRMGYAEAAERIQELYLAGRKDEAVATVPDDYVDERCLVGSPERIRERYVAWAESGITGMSLATNQPAALELLAECAREQPAVGVQPVGS